MSEGRPLWRTAAASVRGPDHVAAGRACEDAFCCRSRGDLLVAVVSDGAGSARFAQTGARVVARTLTLRLAAALGEGEAATGIRRLFAALAVEPDDDRAMAQLLGLVMEAIEATRAHLATVAGPAPLADFHATALGAIATAAGGILFHLGDGAGAAARRTEGGGHEAFVSPPAQEYADETYFVTMPDWRDRLRLTPFPPCDLVALATDGAAPFVFAPRWAALAEDFAVPLTRHLAGLAGPLARSRCLREVLSLPDAAATASGGDDKTLLWAYAVEAPPPR